MNIGRPKNTWQEVVENDLKSLHFQESDAVDRKKWRKYKAEWLVVTVGDVHFYPTLIDLVPSHLVCPGERIIKCVCFPMQESHWDCSSFTHIYAAYNTAPPWCSVVTPYF